MITVWELGSEKKEVNTTSFERWQIAKTLSWVDCFYLSAKELENISNKTKIPVDELKNSIDPIRRPHVVTFDNYSLIIFRGLYEEEGKMKTAPVGIFFFEKDILTIHDKPILGLESLRKLPKKNILDMFRKGAPYFVYRFMSFVIDDFFTLMEEVEDEISRLEDQVVHEPNESVTKTIFVEKRNLIAIYKSLVANREVLSALEKQYIREFKKEDLRLLRDLYNDTTQLIDLVTTHRDMLTSILDMYLSSISNNLNKVMKTLTIISAFVMVPTMIAGIYGMNFQKTSAWNMPELYWAHGYLFALGIMVFAVILLALWFRKRGWM